MMTVLEINGAYAAFDDDDLLDRRDDELYGELPNTYSESWPREVTIDEALREIHMHGFRMSDFIAECGAKPVYNAETVLGWMGY